ncbi:16S rRNA (uracil(1498)-N(3))-methyltransferase [Citricoccus sp. GCM10030269]|uniref:16S rRNA (uracil(1498)-N(3))-methyltransferase n=1 Tax=Citricoccus sp. GCM10030269 TaxID=3273388 RepID=UPI0036118F84
MSDPVFYAAEGDLQHVTAGAVVVLTGSEARHAAQVMRLGPGERVDVADGTGRRVSGSVLSAAPDRLEVTAESVVDEPVPSPELVLVQALAKGDRDVLAIQTATELGIDAVHPWQAERSIVRWKAEKAAKAIAKWDAALVAAAKQSRRARIPHTRSVFSGTGVADVAASGTVVLVLHEDAETSLETALREAEHARQIERIVLVVGPEGGISPAEIDALVQAGGVPCVLGPHVLRSSTAGPAAVAVIQQLLGRFGTRS